jgi:hypothetical protein
MKEQFNKPEDEMLNAYGEDMSAPSNELLPEAQDDRESSGDLTVAEQQAEVLLAELSPEDRKDIEQIAALSEFSFEKLSSESALDKDRASESLLGSAFAAAATSDLELQDAPLWKKALRGASLGARNAVKAVALAATIASPAAAQDYQHPSPDVQKKVEYIFGSSILERFGDRRASYKRAYTDLEVRKNALLAQLHDLTDPSPHTTAEAAHVQRVEADRDAKLAALNVERTLEKMSYEGIAAPTEADAAQYKANLADIAAREAQAIDECESTLLEAHRQIAPEGLIEDLRREIIKIESKEDEIVQRFLAMRQEDQYRYGGAGYNWTSWN